MSESVTDAFNASELDWTHINETILMIGLAVAQIEKTLNDGDESISVLTSSFINMMASLSTITSDINEIHSKDEVTEIMGNANDFIETLDINDTDKDKINKYMSSLVVGITTGSRERVKSASEEASRLIQDTIIAFQFYDRLSQRLHQIVSSLGMMSQLFADKQRLHNPYEWAELQDSIKARYTIDADRIMFDALLAGATIEEAVDIAGEYEGEAETEENEIELF